MQQSISPSGVIVSVNTSPSKGMRKSAVLKAKAVAGHGIDGDAHAATPTKQISLLAMESIEKMCAKGLDLGPGDFAENLTTRGIALITLKIGDRLETGRGVLLEISEIGKICHDRCAIYYQVGDCVMPREGVFARVIRGGMLTAGDEIKPATYLGDKP